MSDPTIATVAETYRKETKRAVLEMRKKILLVGFLTEEQGPSKIYADYTKAGCADVGIDFEVRMVNKYKLEDAILRANADNQINGIITYYPIFGTGQDSYLKNVIDHRKDVEGLSFFWLQKLYKNERHYGNNPSIKPCTPLSLIKAISAFEVPRSKRVITIFNRSEVVGRPLAAMLANDGATVYSIDASGIVKYAPTGIEETGLKRWEALGQSNIVVTGVPDPKFELVKAEEIGRDTLCINFSTTKNFADDVKAKARCYIPRVGPLTVAMLLRNCVFVKQWYQ